MPKAENLEKNENNRMVTPLKTHAHAGRCRDSANFDRPRSARDTMEYTTIVANVVRSGLRNAIITGHLPLDDVDIRSGEAIGRPYGQGLHSSLILISPPLT